MSNQNLSPDLSQDSGQDIDLLETQEWLDALESVLEVEGPERAHFLIEQMIEKVRRSGVNLPHSSNTNRAFRK